MKKYSDIKILKRLFLQARTYWPHIACIFLLDLLATPLVLLTPLPLKIAVDSIVGSEKLPGFLTAAVPDFLTNSKGSILLFAVGLIMVIALMSQLQKFVNWLLKTYTGEKLVLDFRANLMRHAQSLSLAYHDSRGTADSIYRIQWDAPNIQWIIIYGIAPFITAAFTLTGMVFITMKIDWQLALIALSAAPVILFLTKIFRQRLRKQWTEVKNIETSALSVIQEVLTALRVVKAFGQEDNEQGRFVRRSHESIWARIHVILSESAFSISIGLTIALGTAAVFFIGVKHTQTGILTLGEFILVMSYLAQLYQPLQTIGRQVASLQGGLASAERSFSLLDKAPDVIEKPDALPLKRAAGTIEFDNVYFSYTGEHMILQDISFKVPSNTRVGIMGKTGSGKTSLMNLLTRFYDPTIGRILLDGIDLRNYKQADLRNQFAIVLQEPVLFSTSIAENIAYGRPGATENEVMDAAKAANAHDFIVTFKEGYDTLVGERGMRLSGGERQRIALARAFLKDAPILILDEPTSSVDVKTEAGIMEAMERLMKGRTTFMIAHRLSTLEDCDLLIMIENGYLLSVTPNVSNVINYELKFNKFDIAESSSLEYSNI